jgi:hypothetical protein
MATKILNLWQKYKTLVILALLSFVVIFLLIKYPLSKDTEIKQLLNNVLQFSGIFSAILITFIVPRVIQNIQIKKERNKKIVKFSNKTTHFRHIARILIEKNNFWENEMRKKLMIEYAKFELYDYYFKPEPTVDINAKLQLRTKFLADKENGLLGSLLFLDLRSLVEEDQVSDNTELYSLHDLDVYYPLNVLHKWKHANNGSFLSYYFSNNEDSYNHFLHCDSIPKDKQDEIIKLCELINPRKYKNEIFNAKLLDSIGEEFHSYILPKLYELTKENCQELPKSIILLLKVFTLVLIFGVIIPLVLTAISINDNVLRITSSLVVFILFICFTGFILYFKRILLIDSEIK